MAADGMSERVGRPAVGTVTPRGIELVDGVGDPIGSSDGSSATVQGNEDCGSGARRREGAYVRARKGQESAYEQQEAH